MSKLAKRVALAAGCLGLALAVTAPAAFAAPSFYGSDANGNLLEIEKVKKAKRKGGKKTVEKFYAATSRTPVQFTPAGASRLVGIDQRPISGELYGVGDNGVVYRINPRTGVATGVAGPATAPFAVGLAGTAFGVDFNPTSPGGGAIRIVSDANYNNRVGPDTGAQGAGTPDGSLNGAAGARIVDAAYTNSALSVVQPTSTQLFVLDSADDRLYLQNPPNAGTLTAPVDVSFDVTDVGGFDIFGASAGFVATQVGGGSRLYGLDIASGQGIDLGQVKRTSTLTGLAVQQK